MKLQHIKFGEGNLDKIFNSNIHEYKLKLDKTATQLHITTGVQDTKNKWTVNNEHSVEITIGDGTETTIKKVVIGAFPCVSYKTYRQAQGTLNSNGEYTFELINPSSNANLILITVDHGTITPVFDPNTNTYTVPDVENEFDTITFTCVTEDPTARVTINGNTAYTIPLIVGSNSVIITVTAEDGTVKTYTFTVIRANAQVPNPPTPVNPDMPDTREDATILLPDPPENFSTIPSDSNGSSCIEYKYGWWEIKNNPKYQEAYVRIYNMFLNNGNKVNTYSVTQPDGTTKTNIPVFIKLNVNGNSYSFPQEAIDYAQNPSNPSRYDMTYKLINDPSKSTLGVYLYDLELSHAEAEYIYSLVMDDCPELMYKFQAGYVCMPFPKQMIVSGGTLTPAPGDPSYVVCIATQCFFKESTRQSMMQSCVDTLNEINKIIDHTYGIKFCNQPFNGNNQLYTPVQMIQIGKVIHDYLEVYNIYGREGGHYINQTMYPALSRGKWNPVCASYAKAFQYCCWRWGINATSVSGICDANGDGQPEESAGHAWSLVCYQNKTITGIMNSSSPGQYWQEVDCTWDDSGPACGFDYGTTQTPNLEQDYPALTNNAQKTNGWDDSSTCRWDYFNITTADIEANTPGASGTSGGAGARARRTPYKRLINGTCNKYTYNGNELYKGFESITE